MHARAGGDVGGMVEALARSLERRGDLKAAAQAAVSGAKLSGRVVAALPALLLPMAPLARAPLFDVGGIALLVIGVSLAGAGVACIEKLVPSPPRHDDGCALVGELVAGALRAGVGLDIALFLAAVHAPDDVSLPLRRARRMAQLGMSWPRALERAGDRGAAALGEALAAGDRWGLPVASALDTFAARRREEMTRTFEAAARRAPVLMVVPLTLLVLPAFVLVGLGPFLRGLSLSW